MDGVHTSSGPTADGGDANFVKAGTPRMAEFKILVPATTPGGVDLDKMTQRRLAELDDPNELLFPAPRGGWARRSNYGRNLWDLACEFIAWPKNPDGDAWYWTFYSLRHAFATWALAPPNIGIEDVSRSWATRRSASTCAQTSTTGSSMPRARQSACIVRQDCRFLFRTSPLARPHTSSGGRAGWMCLSMGHAEPWPASLDGEDDQACDQKEEGRP